MSFLWPGMLVLLVVVPLVVVGYVRLMRRRAERAAALAAQGFAPNAAARRLRRVRHVPAVLFLVAVVVLVVAFARPEVSVGLPQREGTVILAFDVSNSMLAKDLQPTRMDAAKAAAKQFVERQPGSIKIGVVAFNNGALITQQPTASRADRRACTSTPSASAAPRARWCRSVGSAWPPRSTRKCSRRSRRSPTASTSTPRTPRRCRRSTRASTSAP